MNELAKFYVESLVALATLGAVYFASRSATASEKANQASFMPVISIELRSVDQNRASCIIRNIGRDIARNIKIKINGADLFGIITHPILVKDGEKMFTFNYNVKNILDNPVSEISYQDIFDNNIKTTVMFLCRKFANKNEYEQIESISWQIIRD